MSSYETLAHSAIGQGLNELGLGIQVGKSLRQLFGKPAYFETGYSYSFVEKIDDISLNRSNASLELGVLVSPRIVTRVFTGGQITHGGIDWVSDFETEEEFFIHWAGHDRGAAADFLNAGLGIGFELTPQLNINVSYLSTFWGENYQDLRAFTVGFQTTFGGIKIGGKPDRNAN